MEISTLKISTLPIVLILSLFGYPNEFAYAKSPLMGSLVLIRNADLVITMDPNLGAGPLGTIEGGDVRFDGDTIVAVGQGLATGNAEIVDATGKIVMPGFVDVHNHLWQSLIRGCGADKELPGWLAECLFPMPAANITEAEAYAGVRLSTIDLIDSGVTTVVDISHSFTTDFVEGNLRALEDSGLRFSYAYCGQAPAFDHMRQIKATRTDLNPLADFQVCAHPAVFFQQWVTDATALSIELDIPLNLHVLEHIDQRVQEQPIAVMQQAGVFNGGVKLQAGHNVHLNEDEIALFAQHDVPVAHNPVSNMRLASGIMRTPEMKAAGLRIGLGLDGGANDNSDFFANMKAAVGVQRAIALDASVFPTLSDVLYMATMGGAEVLDMAATIGSLTPNKKADIIIIDPGDTNFAPRWDWLNQIVLNGQPSNVEFVFVNGKPLKVARQVTGVSRVKIVQDAEAAVLRIKTAIQNQ